jgi:hypothetical protein
VPDVELTDVPTLPTPTRPPGAVRYIDVRIDREMLESGSQGRRPNAGCEFPIQVSDGVVIRVLLDIAPPEIRRLLKKRHRHWLHDHAVRMAKPLARHGGRG